MEKRDQELIQKYISSDPELKQHMDEHETYERKLEEMNRLLYLTPEEEVERKRIQKLKLAGRDRIEVILAKYRSQGARG
jgi:septum formation topological specificity factor MinE